MDTLLSLASFGVILAVFGVIAAILGEDTRDGFADGFRDGSVHLAPLPVSHHDRLGHLRRRLRPSSPPRAAASSSAPGSGRGLLATVRGDAPPRINPVSVGIVDGHLLTVRHRRFGEGPRPARGRPVRAPRPPGPGRAARVPRPRPGRVVDGGAPADGDRRLAVRGRTTATACTSSSSSRRCSASGRRGRLAAGLPELALRRPDRLEHDHLARRLARAEAVERVLELRRAAAAGR